MNKYYTNVDNKFEFINRKIDYYLHKFKNLENCRKEISHFVNLIIECYENGGKIMICGNGGSLSDANHITAELMKSFLKDRNIEHNYSNLQNLSEHYDMSFINSLQGGLPAISLGNNTSLITAISNDIDPDLIFAQQLIGLGRKNDILWIISTSGTSKNIIKASLTAKLLDLKCIGLTGENKNILSSICDAVIRVPYKETQHIQESHMVIYHMICDIVESYFF